MGAIGRGITRTFNGYMKLEKDYPLFSSIVFGSAATSLGFALRGNQEKSKQAQPPAFQFQPGDAFVFTKNSQPLNTGNVKFGGWREGLKSKLKTTKHEVLNFKDIVEDDVTPNRAPALTRRAKTYTRNVEALPTPSKGRIDSLGHYRPAEVRQKQLTSQQALAKLLAETVKDTNEEIDRNIRNPLAIAGFARKVGTIIDPMNTHGIGPLTAGVSEVASNMSFNQKMAPFGKIPHNRAQTRKRLAQSILDGETDGTQKVLDTRRRYTRIKPGKQGKVSFLKARYQLADNPFDPYGSASKKDQIRRELENELYSSGSDGEGGIPAPLVRLDRGSRSTVSRPDLPPISPLRVVPTSRPSLAGKVPQHEAWPTLEDLRAKQLEIKSTREEAAFASFQASAQAKHREEVDSQNAFARSMGLHQFVRDYEY